MDLHSQKVEVGDKVYDLLEGYGTVINILDGQMSVKFSNNRAYAYNGAGKRLGNTPPRFPVLLYWDNPIVMVPLKNDSRWGAMKDLLKNSYQVIKEIK